MEDLLSLADSDADLESQLLQQVMNLTRDPQAIPYSSTSNQVPPTSYGGNLQGDRVNPDSYPFKITSIQQLKADDLAKIAKIVEGKTQMLQHHIKIENEKSKLYKKVSNADSMDKINEIITSSLTEEERNTVMREN